jgi:hypothetical protein
MNYKNFTILDGGRKQLKSGEIQRKTSGRIHTGYPLNTRCMCYHRANQLSECNEVLFNNMKETNTIDIGSCSLYDDLLIMYQLPRLFLFMLSSTNDTIKSSKEQKKKRQYLYQKTGVTNI